jgi:hypothetical protein
MSFLWTRAYTETQWFTEIWKTMFRKQHLPIHFLILVLILAPAALLLAAAAEPAWRGKPVSQWSEEDAKQVLAASPWVAMVKVAVIPVRGEDQMREGGKMGGAGAETIRKKSAGNGLSRQVTIRWESALALRSAEMIAHEAGAPDWDGDYYVIAVYEVAGLSGADRNTIGGELRKMALLKRDGRKDLQPARVDIVASARGLSRVVYLFPRTSPITLDDQRVQFVAQIRRMSITQQFVTQEMQIQGKLEL